LQALFQNKVTTTTTTAAMKFSIVLFAVLSAAPTVVQAASMTTCNQQANCLDFTTTKLNSVNDCSQTECAFEVCMKVNQSKAGCTKSGAISHTCEKASLGCTEDDGGFFGKKIVENVPDNYMSCQTVHGNSTAEFLMKDGSGSCGAMVASGADISCMALEDKYTSGGSCTGNVGMECMWSVKTPLCDAAAATTADEPPPAEEQESPPPAQEPQTFSSQAEEEAYWTCQ
jgi:hypothetical protein